jgi:putative ABC transport system permease protein
MALTDWTIIRKSMFARLFSTLTTTLTVAVAVGLLLVLLMMRDSGRRAFERGSGNMHLLISADTSPLNSVLNSVFYAALPPRPIQYVAFNQLLAKLPPMEFAIPTQHGDSYKGFRVTATTPEFFSKFEPQKGEPWFFAEGAGFTGEFEIVAGAIAARELGLRVGQGDVFLTHGSGASREGGGQDETHVHKEYGFKVVGILGASGSAHDRALFINLNSAWILHANDRLEREVAAEHAEHAEEGEHDHDHDHAHEAKLAVADLKDEDRKITGAYLRLLTRDGSDTPANLPQVFYALRSDPSITVAQPKQEIDKLFLIVGNIDQILVGMAIVVMVSSGIAIMLALYNSMDQRRRQIAVLRVLGCSQGRIFGLVITESAVVGLAGAAAGTLLALLGGRLVAVIMKQRLGIVVDPNLTPQLLVMIVAATVVLAGLAGVIPALLAYRTPVAKNLRPLG